MAREIGGIEVVLQLDAKDFDKGITEATKDIDDFNKEVKESSKTLGNMEKRQDALLSALKETKVGTQSYNNLRRELARTNSEVRDLELGFEGLDVEQRASELKSVVGGFGDMATGLAAVSAQLGGADLEEYIKKVETVEKVTVGVTGSMESWASLQKLIQSQNTLTSQSFKTLGKSISAASVKITAIVGGTVALGVALKSIYDISEPLQNAVENIFEGFNSAIVYIKKQFISFIDTIIDGWNSLPDDLFEPITKSASEFVNGAAKDFSDFFKDVGGVEFAEAFKNNFEEIGDLVKSGIATVQDYWNTLTSPKQSISFDDSALKEVFEDIDVDNIFEGLEDDLNKSLEGIKATESLINDDVIAATQKQLDKLDVDYLKNQQDQINNTSQSFGELSNAISGVSNAAEEGSAAQEGLLAASKAVGIAQIALNQAVAISEAIKNPGNYLGGPIGAAVSVAASVATVAAAFASIPSFASGGTYRHSEAGQSENIIPTNRMNEVFNNNQSGRETVIEIDGQPILRATEKASNKRNRTRSINSRF